MIVNSKFPGDDQDLDDKIIHELWIENRELKEELDTLKTTKEHSDAKEGEVLEPMISRLCLWTDFATMNGIISVLALYFLFNA